MDAKERRGKILEILKKSNEPTSGASLSKLLNVSRQVIVGDIGLLRASGEEIISTPKGYLIKSEEKDDYIVKTIVCNHTKDCIEEELNLIVDEGATILNVIVEHSLYGQLTGNLHISSRRDVKSFIKNLENDSANPLSQLTDGIHLHTIKCENEEILQSVLKSLKEKGYAL